MAVAARGSVPAPFELKSASLSVVALLLKTGDLDDLAAAMTAQFGDPPHLFDHDPVIVDLSQLDADAGDLDFPALTTLLRRQRLLPVGVRGGSDGQRAAALAAGLGEVAASPAPSEAAGRRAAVENPPSDSQPSDSQPSESRPTESRPTETSAPSAAALPEPVAANAALTIDKPLRSGQQVYAKGGDLIVLAAVNFGAEVLADGNIHVYGPLRGKAVAGAKGNADARIFSTCMEPELVAIAGTYRTTENPLPAEVVGKPAQIRLAGDRLVFEPLA